MTIEGFARFFGAKWLLVLPPRPDPRSATYEDRVAVTRMVIAPLRAFPMRTSLLALALAIVPACTTSNDLDTDDIDAPDDDGKADAAADLSVRAGETTLWVDKALVRKGDAFVLHARTSRNLTD